jgi:hypothetical protein
MKCAFCGEEFEGIGYKVSGDMRVCVEADIVGSKQSIVVLKEIGDVCSRNCQIASEMVIFENHNCPEGETPDTELDRLSDVAFKECDCTIEEFEGAMTRYNEAMSRKILMLAGDCEKYL